MELTDWTLRPLKKLVIEDTAYYRETGADYAPALLGDWKDALGEDYSGTAEYRTTFSLPKGATELLLDLGKAAHAAEVYCNGSFVGARVMPPYHYQVPASLLKEENELIVRVTSGIANAFESTHAFDKYYPWQLGTYIKEERIFHRDSKESGLFGQVKLYYK